MFSKLMVLVAGVVAGFGASVRAEAYEIRGVSDPIYHLYLQPSPTDASTPVLGPVATAEFYDITTTIQSTNTSMYLNIGTATTSYLPLSFSKTANTTAWGLEGDTIITTTASSYGRQLNFLTCELSGGYYSVFLQTGSDVPSSGNCSNYQSLHLPCLC